MEGASVSFLDLAAAHVEAQPEIQAALARVASSGVYLRGREVAAFERAWAEACGVRGVVTTSSGTDAIRLALLGCGVGPGDEVVVPAFGSPYTAIAVRATGATPRFADIDPSTHNVSVASVEEALGPRTRAVVAVHLYGRRAEVAALRALCDGRGLKLVEDAAQAHALAGPPSGHAVAHSFYPTKNLGALGDAGSVASDDEALLERVRLLREGGQDAALQGTVACGVARMDELQAAVLLAKLPHLAAWTARRRAVAERYRAALADCPSLTLPRAADAGEHVWHLFVVEHPDRAAFERRLAEAGIETRAHYPYALHELPLFASSADGRRLPAAARAGARVLSLPLHPGLTDDAVSRVIDAVRRAA
jgi:dTDP-3-amino-3,4,6-trideoxy-alpha-D-glucose transaminase